MSVGNGCKIFCYIVIKFVGEFFYEEKEPGWTKGKSKFLFPYWIKFNIIHEAENPIPIHSQQKKLVTKHNRTNQILLMMLFLLRTKVEPWNQYLQVSIISITKKILKLFQKLLKRKDKMTLTNQQKNQIKNLIKQAITDKINEYRLVGDIKPFHERLFSKERIRETSFFHSCSTTIGVTLFQNIAYLIAEGNKNFKQVEKQYVVDGNFSKQAQSIIEEIIFDLGRKHNDPRKRTPDIKKEAKEVLAVSSKQGNKSTQIADLFLVKLNGEEICIEIKTTKPNKGESKEAKRGMLKIIALKNKQITTLVGMAYNPYEPDEFKWPLPLNYLRLGEDLLVGKSFWDFLGGDKTYEELLEIFEEVGNELKDKIEKKIKEVMSLNKQTKLK